MTLKELQTKLNSVIRNHKIEIEGEVITDAWIAGPNDKDYPEGTLLLECRSNNVRRIKVPEDSHILSLYPTNLGKLN